MASPAPSSISSLAPNRELPANLRKIICDVLRWCQHYKLILQLNIRLQADGKKKNQEIRKLAEKVKILRTEKFIFLEKEARWNERNECPKQRSFATQTDVMSANDSFMSIDRRKTPDNESLCSSGSRSSKDSGINQSPSETRYGTPTHPAPPRTEMKNLLSGETENEQHEESIEDVINNFISQKSSSHVADGVSQKDFSHENFATRQKKRRAQKKNSLNNTTAVKVSHRKQPIVEEKMNKPVPKKALRKRASSAKSGDGARCKKKAAVLETVLTEIETATTEPESTSSERAKSQNATRQRKMSNAALSVSSEQTAPQVFATSVSKLTSDIHPALKPKKKRPPRRKKVPPEVQLCDVEQNLLLTRAPHIIPDQISPTILRPPEHLLNAVASSPPAIRKPRKPRGAKEETNNSQKTPCTRNKRKQRETISEPLSDISLDTERNSTPAIIDIPEIPFHRYRDGSVGFEAPPVTDSLCSATSVQTVSLHADNLATETPKLEDFDDIEQMLDSMRIPRSISPPPDDCAEMAEQEIVPEQELQKILADFRSEISFVHQPISSRPMSPLSDED